MALAFRKKRLWWGGAGVAVLAGAAVWIALFDQPEGLCDGAGGKWASATKTCITRSCYASGTCGTWANTAGRCDRLKLGDTRAELYFQLGNPVQVAADKLVWPVGKASDGEIVALLRNGHLTALQCGAISLAQD